MFSVQDLLIMLIYDLRPFSFVILEDRRKFPLNTKNFRLFTFFFIQTQSITVLSTWLSRYSPKNDMLAIKIWLKTFMLLSRFQIIFLYKGKKLEYIWRAPVLRLIEDRKLSSHRTFSSMAPSMRSRSVMKSLKFFYTYYQRKCFIKGNVWSNLHLNKFLMFSLTEKLSHFNA